MRSAEATPYIIRSDCIQHDSVFVATIRRLKLAEALEGGQMSQRSKGDPGQVLDVMRDVLLEHMDKSGYVDSYRPQTIVTTGKRSGRIITRDDVISCRDVPGGLLITMRDGSEYRLTLEFAISPVEEWDDGLAEELEG